MPPITTISNATTQVISLSAIASVDEERRNNRPRPQSALDDSDFEEMQYAGLQPAQLAAEIEKVLGASSTKSQFRHIVAGVSPERMESAFHLVVKGPSMDQQIRMGTALRELYSSDKLPSFIPVELFERGRASRVGNVTSVQFERGISREFVSTLTAEPNWAKLSTSQQQMYANILQECLVANAAVKDPSTVSGATAKVEESILALLRRNVGQGKDQVPALLQRDIDENAAERTTLDHLHRLAKEQGVPALRPAQKLVLISTVNELANPSGNINTGDVNTCVPSLVQSRLAGHRPAEMARIMEELVLAGQARVVVEDKVTGQRRLSQHVLDDPIMKVTKEVPAAAELKGRSYTEYYFQRAAAGLVAGDEDGLLNGATERLCEHVYGIPFRRYDKGDANISAILAGAAGANPGETFNLVAINWPQDPTTPQSGAPVSVQMPDVLHLIEVVRQEGGYYYCRNPWGSSRTNLPAALKAETVDPKQGLFRMKKADFDARVEHVFIPEDEGPSKVRFGITPGAVEKP